jgi:predicted TPR repeat methyltransferase
LEKHLALNYFKQGQFEQLEACCQALSKQHPKDGFGWQLLGLAIKMQGRDAEAVSALQIAARLLPNDWQSHVNLGSTYLALGKLSAAESCFTQALLLSPDNLKALDTLGDIQRRLGKTEAALKTFQRRLSLTPDDGHTQHLVAMLSGQQTSSAPADYVSRTFDEYAEHFDQHLTGVLQYQVPTLIQSALTSHASEPRGNWDVLDLGCGTGLVGEVIAPWSGKLVGVDLSSKMLTKAQDRQLYQELICADLLSMMRAAPSASFDLIVAGDVFVYIGQLDELIKESRRLLRPDGLFIFTTETLANSAESEPYRLRETGRYCHAPDALARQAAQHAFTILSSESATLRMDGQTPIQGQISVWRA